MHARMYMRRYIHVYTPTDGRPIERSPWSQLGSNITRDRPVRWVSIRQTHTRGFHPCYHLAARPHLVNSAHLYEHTHTYTPHMLAYESWFPSPHSPSLRLVMNFCIEIWRESNQSIPSVSQCKNSSKFVVPGGEFAWEHLPVHVVQESKPGMVVPV